MRALVVAVTVKQCTYHRENFHRSLNLGPGRPGAPPTRRTTSAGSSTTASASSSALQTTRRVERACLSWPRTGSSAILVSISVASDGGRLPSPDTRLRNIRSPTATLAQRAPGTHYAPPSGLELVLQLPMSAAHAATTDALHDARASQRAWVLLSPPHLPVARSRAPPWWCGERKSGDVHNRPGA